MPSKPAGVGSEQADQARVHKTASAADPPRMLEETEAERIVALGEQSTAPFAAFLEAAPDAIVVVDTAGRITMVNGLAERMFGYERQEMLAQWVAMLVPERFRQGHVRPRQQYLAVPRTRSKGAGQALTGLKKDGAEFPIEISLSSLRTDQGTQVVSIIRNITDRLSAEAKFRGFLESAPDAVVVVNREGGITIKVTSSLLKLQSACIQDPRALEMFGDSQNRIRSMALEHEKLYQSSDLSRVNFSDDVESLAALLFRSYGVNASRIRLSIEADQAFLSIETAVPCGLIVNELLSNCLKHAFPEKRSGQIRIRISEAPGGDWLLLAVADNGVGLPPGLDLEQTDTLGLQLVRTLTRQLNGHLELATEGGTEFRVRFPIGKSI